MSDAASPYSTQLSSALNMQGSGVRSMSFSPDRNSKGKNWTKLRATVIATHLFKTPDVSVMHDINELLHDIEKAPYPRLPADHTELSTAIEAHRLVEGLFQLVVQGGPEDLTKIDTILQNDPRRYIRSSVDSQSLVNKKSPQGHTLIYEASLHGNAAVVQLLLSHGGDPHEPSPVSLKEVETPLEAASRWGHLKVVEVLVNSEKWNPKELKSALKLSANDDVKVILERLELLRANSNCVDCFIAGIDAADILHGVFLCDACAQVHKQELKFPVKYLDEIFLPEEISFLAEKGNEKLNRTLCRTVYPWFAAPKEFPYLAVRIHWAKAKYLSRAFAIEIEKQQDRHNLDQFWFYLDEVTEETPSVVGPTSREELRKARDLREVIYEESYVWHPVLGRKWLQIEKLYAEIIDPETALPDHVIHEAYEKRMELLSHPLPHLRGYLDVTVKSKIQRKWVILRRNLLYINTYNYTSSTDQPIPLETHETTLLEIGPRLGIKLQGPDTDLLLTSSSSAELLEWFNAIRCVKHLLLIARVEDLMEGEVDMTEQHVCNVRNSPTYMGLKRKEGLLKKEGSSWKTIKTRWFILRTQGLYYYANQTDKTFRGSLQLHGARVNSVEQYKSPNHFVVKTESKTLHLWAEDESQRESWVEAIQSVASSLSEDFSVYSLRPDSL